MKSVFAGLAAVVFAAGAQAASLPVIGLAPISENYVLKQTTIEYSPIAAGDKAAAAALLARIDQAVQAVCSSGRQFHSASMDERITKCRAHATADALQRVGSPELTAAAAQR